MTPARTIVVTRPSVPVSWSVSAMPSAEHGEASFLGQLVERLLHDVADVGVDLVDVGVLAELGDDVDGRAAPA